MHSRKQGRKCSHVPVSRGDFHFPTRCNARACGPAAVTAPAVKSAGAERVERVRVPSPEAAGPQTVSLAAATRPAHHSIHRHGAAEPVATIGGEAAPHSQALTTPLPAAAWKPPTPAGAATAVHPCGSCRPGSAPHSRAGRGCRGWDIPARLSPPGHLPTPSQSPAAGEWRGSGPSSPSAAPRPSPLRPLKWLNKGILAPPPPPLRLAGGRPRGGARCAGAGGGATGRSPRQRRPRLGPEAAGVMEAAVKWPPRPHPASQPRARCPPPRPVPGSHAQRGFSFPATVSVLPRGCVLQFLHEGFVPWTLHPAVISLGTGEHVPSSDAPSLQTRHHHPERDTNAKGHQPHGQQHRPPLRNSLPSSETPVTDPLSEVGSPQAPFSPGPTRPPVPAAAESCRGSTRVKNNKSEK